MSSPPPSRVRIGKLWIDSLTFDGAIECIAALVSAGKGGSVFTPNVDHVVKVEHDEGFRSAYERVSLSLVDGTPLLWASRWLKTPLPQKISGSDLVMPLTDRAAKEKWRVYLLGGAPGIADQAAAILKARGTLIVGTDSPFIDPRGNDKSDAETLAKLRAAKPDVVLVALGAPKQELWIDRVQSQIAPAVALGIGASLDFVAGKVTRAPAWVSKAGLEWLYRLGQEPRRLWRRYLVEDPAFVAIVMRTSRLARADRVKGALASGSAK